MNIKLISRDKYMLNALLERVLNITEIVASRGDVFDEMSMWTRNGDRYDMPSNDYRVYLTDETDTSVTLKFWYRYDVGDSFANTLSALLVSRFPEHISYTDV
jgi:hypothetical protein